MTKPDWIKPDWKKVLLKAWSTRWMVAAGVFGAAEIVLPMMSDEIPRVWFALGVVVSITGGLIARISVQKEFSNEISQKAGSD